MSSGILTVGYQSLVMVAATYEQNVSDDRRKGVVEVVLLAAV